jgi:hypothetical protein
VYFSNDCFFLLLRNNLRLPTAQLLPKIGGRVLDLPINVLDDYRMKYLHEMNCLAQTELVEESHQRQMAGQAEYIAKTIQEEISHLEELDECLKIIEEQLKPTLSAEAFTPSAASVSSSSSSSVPMNVISEEESITNNNYKRDIINSDNSYTFQYPQPPMLFE